MQIIFVANQNICAKTEEYINITMRVVSDISTIQASRRTPHAPKSPLAHHGLHMESLDEDVGVVVSGSTFTTGCCLVE